MHMRCMTPTAAERVTQLKGAGQVLIVGGIIGALSFADARTHSDGHEEAPAAHAMTGATRKLRDRS